MLLKTASTMAGGLALGAVSLLPSVVHAQVLCDDLTNLPNKIYGVGGSAVTATLKRIALAIEKDPNKTEERTTIIYHDDLGACAGYQAFLNGKVDGKFRYWISNADKDADQRCDARPGGQPVDFSHMGNDAAFCPQGSVPDGVGDFVAPVQTLNFITDAASNQEVISAEALYFIYGFGATGQASPWTDGSGVFTRQPDSFAALLIADAIGVPATAFKWQENLKDTQGAVISGITSYATTEALARQTLGFVSGSAADRGRSPTPPAKPVKTLAYQHYDQACGVYPDSEPSKFDKVNVRQGKYFLWAPGHYYTRIDETGKPLNERVENLLGWYTKKTVPPGTSVDAFEQSILAGDIPECAMQVSRDGTLGAIASYASPKPCGCYFEQVTNPAVTSSCTVCESDANCGGDTPSCNFGYCESYRNEGEEEG